MHARPSNTGQSALFNHFNVRQYQIIFTGIEQVSCMYAYLSRRMHVCVSITGGAQQALVADRQTADSAYSNAASILSL